VAETKLGLLLGTRGLLLRSQREGTPLDPAPVLELAERAEAAGLDSVWVGDSLVSKPRLEPVAMLAAIAARTKRVKLGTAVLLPALRPVVPLAHSLATVDVLSGGRALIAAGVGGAFNADQQQDWAAAGVDKATRAGRLTEMVQVMKRLWTGEPVTFHGRHFTLDDITLLPRPIQPGGVPLLLATHYKTGSEAQARRAARYADGVMGITDSPEQYAQMWEAVAGFAREEGRDPESMERAYYMTVHIGDDRAAAKAEGEEFLMGYYKVNHWGGNWGPWGPPDEVAERMLAFVRAGVGHLVVRFAAWDQPAQWARFEAEVLPRFRAGLA
jgi:alkanesulfonate monooxygenase SsuD/methylene tetrahydromethanopterin reductase-like flavin-dependent oxidoreductase (luciferase family)